MATEQERSSDPFERSARPATFGFALAVLAVYTYTLYPSVPGGDSGELIVAAHRLGVAHPPGYPLYTLLAHAFTWIPLGSIAWRVNFLTAVCGALAAALVLRAAWRHTGDFGAGLTAGGLFAFSPLVWRHSLGAEVFSLNHCFVAVLLWLLVEFERRPRAAIVPGFALTCGLGLTNHQTLLFVGLPIGAWIVWRARRLLGPAGWLRALAWGLAGLLPYLYLLLSPARDPTTTWGGTGSVSGAIDHVLRKQYGTFRLGATERGSNLLESLAAFATDLPGDTLFAGAVLALVGVAGPFLLRDRLAGERRIVPAVVLAALAFYLLVFHTMTNLPIDDPLFYRIQSRFWQQAHLLVCFLAGAGLALLVRTVLRRGAIVAASLAAVLVVAQLAVHYAAENRRGNRYIADAAAATLAGLPPAALVVSKGDLQWNSLRYLQVCEGLRPDVRIVDIELLKAPWRNDLVRDRLPGVTLPGTMYRAPRRGRPGSYDLRALFDANVAAAALLTNAMDHDGDTSWRAAYTSWPEGAFDRVYPAGRPVDLQRYARLGRVWAEQIGPRPATVAVGTWEEVAWRGRLDFGTRLATRLLNEALTAAAGRRYLDQAGRMLEAAVATGERLESSVFLNLGIYYSLRRGEDPGAVQKMVTAWRRYLELAPDAPQSALVREALEDPARAKLDIGGF